MESILLQKHANDLSYSKQRGLLLLEVQEIIETIVTKYNSCLSQQVIDKLKNTLEKGKKLESSYRSKFTPMFMKHARDNANGLLHPDEFSRSVSRAVKTFEDYLSKAQFSDPVLLAYYYDYEGMTVKLENLGQLWETLTELEAQVRELSTEPVTDTGFRALFSLFSDFVEKYYKPYHEGYMELLTRYDGSESRCYNVLERMMAVNSTVITNSGTKSDVRTIRNAIAHGQYEKKGNCYRIYDENKLYSKEFTMSSLADFMLSAMRKTRYVFDIIVFLESLVVYQLLIVTYRGE